MIDCYCKVCGLFISIPDEYAGGSGDCPRCRTQLRIPIPVSPDKPVYKKRLRYIALDATQKLNEDLPTLCDASYGSSNRYVCSKCGQLYESINKPSHQPGKCPACGTLNDPAINDIKFAREYSTGQGEDDSLSDTVDEELPIENGYLLVQPRNKDEIKETDVIIDGIAIDESEPAVAAVEDAADKYPTDESYDADEKYPTDEAIAEETPDQKESQTEPQPVVLEPQPEPKPVQPSRTTHPLKKPRSTNSANVIAANMDIKPGQWAYFIRGQVQGPVDTATLKQKFRSGELSQAVLVWKPGIEGFQAVDRFEELRIDIEQEDIIAQPVVREDDSVSTLRMWAKRVQSLMWMSVIVWAAFIVVIAVRQPLQALGYGFFMTLMVIVMAAGIAGIAIAGMLLRSPKMLFKAGNSTTLKWSVALAGFVLALIACFSSLSKIEQPNLFQNVKVYESLAGNGFDAIYNKNVPMTMNKVNWDDFALNGRSVGAEIKKHEREADRQAVIVKAMTYLRSDLLAVKKKPTTQPTTAPATMPATKPSNFKFQWEVISQTTKKTVVRSKGPNGKWILVTIRGEMITAIDVK